MKGQNKMQFTGIKTSIKNFFDQFKVRLSEKAKASPFLTLSIAFIIFLTLILLSSFISTPKKDEEVKSIAPKKVEVYKIGTTSQITAQAQIEKSGVVTITALTGGVVSKTSVVPGSKVKKGANLVALSSNYQGGNIPALQLQTASLQLKNVEDTYQIQKDLINKQKDVAQKSENYGQDLRNIAQKSIDETKSLIALNDSILESIDKDIKAETDEDNIIALKKQKTGYLSANNQLKSALRNTEYEVSNDNPPKKLEGLQKEITLKTLEIQEKGLELSREVARLQYHIAAVSAATMRPSAPFNATVERVFVKVGEAVSPGTPLVVLSQVIEEDPIVGVAYVTREVASKISYVEPSILKIGAKNLEVRPSYITVDAVNGALYAVYFPIPDSYHRSLTNMSYVEVVIPVGMADTGSAFPYIPLDSVYQTGGEAFVFIDNNGIAETKKVELGEVTGSYVIVASGLKADDAIILNRNILSGDLITY